ncbi:MAG: DUF6768 family protein [Algibacter sp.]|uniref:DUF6768 family protein n=1 Tax=Algibacter sp. TaxID=1872428 RepID=UPI0032992893
MKSDKENIDALIKEKLTEEEAKFYEDLDEQNVIEMIFGLFQGKNKWLLILMNVVTVIFFGFFIYCIVQFFIVETTKELLKFGLGSIVFLLGISMLKIFAWMQMDKNAIIRQIKRLELQVSSLAGRIAD